MTGCPHGSGPEGRYDRRNRHNAIAPVTMLPKLKTTVTSVPIGVGCS